MIVIATHFFGENGLFSASKQAEDGWEEEKDQCPTRALKIKSPQKQML